jgi:hypothetical protein
MVSSRQLNVLVDATDVQVEKLAGSGSGVERGKWALRQCFLGAWSALGRVRGRGNGALGERGAGLSG